MYCYTYSTRTQSDYSEDKAVIVILDDFVVPLAQSVDVHPDQLVEVWPVHVQGGVACACPRRRGLYMSKEAWPVYVEAWHETIQGGVVWHYTRRRGL